MTPVTKNPLEVQDTLETILAYCDDKTAARVASTCRVASAAFQTTAEQRKAAKIDESYQQPLRDVFAAHGRPIHTLDVLDMSRLREDNSLEDVLPMRSSVMRFTAPGEVLGIALRIRSHYNNRIEHLWIFKHRRYPDAAWMFVLNKESQRAFGAAHAKTNRHAYWNSCNECPFSDTVFPESNARINFRTVVGPLLAGTHPVARLAD